MKNKLLALSLACIIALGLTGCGTSTSTGSGNNTDAMASTNSMGSNWGFSPSSKNEIAYDTEDIKQEEAGVQDEISDTGNNTQINQNKQEKLVYSANVEMEVKDFDNSTKALKQKINSLDGIIQNESYSDEEPYYLYYERDYSKNTKISGYKNLYTTVRIPTERFNEFVESLNDIGHIKSSSTQVDNITQQYYNNTAYLESYQNQLEVLQNMYNQTGSITEMLEIEARISEVQAEITKLTTVIQSMDMDVNYSTVTIRLSEVVEYSDTPREYQELTFMQKVGQRFVDSWENFVGFLEAVVYIIIDCIWFLIIIAILIVIAIYFSKKRKAKLIKSGRLTKDGRTIMPNGEATEQSVKKKE